MSHAFDRRVQAVLVVEVQYRSAVGQKYRERFRLDFSEFKDRVQVGTPHLYAIAQHLEEIKKDLHHILTGSIALKQMFTTGKIENKKERSLKRRRAGTKMEIRRNQATQKSHKKREVFPC
jgi:ATP-dependent helicase YprA (DUF1998 family)